MNKKTKDKKIKAWAIMARKDDKHNYHGIANLQIVGECLQIFSTKKQAKNQTFTDETFTEIIITFSPKIKHT